MQLLDPSSSSVARHGKQKRRSKKPRIEKGQGYAASSSCFAAERGLRTGNWQAASVGFPATYPTPQTLSRRRSSVDVFGGSPTASSSRVPPFPVSQLNPLMNSEIQNHALELKKLRLGKVVQTLDSIVNNRAKCVLCVVASNGTYGLPRLPTLGSHNLPVNCLLHHHNPSYPNCSKALFMRFTLKPPFGGRNPLTIFAGNVSCLSIQIGWSTRDRKRKIGEVVETEHCRYNDVVKPLMYSLFFLDVPASSCFPRWTPTFLRWSGRRTSGAYAAWLVQHTPGNLMDNFLEVVYHFGCDMRIFFED